MFVNEFYVVTNGNQDLSYFKSKEKAVELAKK